MASALSPRSQAYVASGGADRYGGYGAYLAGGGGSNVNPWAAREAGTQAQPNPFLRGFEQTGLWGTEQPLYQQPQARATRAATPVDPFAGASLRERTRATGRTAPLAWGAGEQFGAREAGRERYNAFLARQGINPNTIGGPMGGTIDRRTGRLIPASMAEIEAGMAAAGDIQRMYGQQQKLAANLRREAQRRRDPGLLAQAMEIGERARQLRRTAGAGSYERAMELAMGGLQQQAIARGGYEPQYQAPANMYAEEG